MMPGRVFNRRFWTPLVWTFTVLVMLGLAVLAFSVRTFVHEEHQANVEQHQIARLAADNCRAGKLMRDALEGLILNQPNIDIRALTILEHIADQLPKRCSP